MLRPGTRASPPMAQEEGGGRQGACEAGPWTEPAPCPLPAAEGSLMTCFLSTAFVVCSVKKEEGEGGGGSKEKHSTREFMSMK